MSRQFLINQAFTMLLLGIGLVGALIARWGGAPMPFMLGALAASGAMAAFFGARYPKEYAFPMPVRLTFIGVIGVAIGSLVDPDMFKDTGGYLISLGAILVFVPVSQFMNFAIFLRIGGYDRVTAWFAGSPGGLIESVTMGEEAGGDVRVMTILQFLRIILVVSFLPIAMSIWHGGPVGSAAGLTLTGEAAGLKYLPLLVPLIVVGHIFGRLARLPAGQLTGPLVAAAVLAWTGWIPLEVPPWLLATAQVVLGVHLGVRFHGVGRALLVKGLGMSFISVAGMLALGLVLALAVGRVTGIALDVLIISYAPGGVTEMGLIAISLLANPTLVALHHLVRITVTVLLLSAAKRMGVLAKLET